METKQSFLKRHKIEFIINLTAIVIFCVLAFRVTHFTDSFDLSFQAWSESIRSISLTPTMLALTNILQPTVLILFTIVASAILFYKKEKTKATVFLFSVAGALISGAVFKDIFKVARPINSLIVETGWSFPSGHATAAAVFFFMTFYFMKKQINRESIKIAQFLVACLLVGLVSFSRVYLGVHHLSDVLAGIALGLFWATLGVLYLERTWEKQTG